MTEAHPLLLGGAFSSPYSLKMRGVLRYRHIPYRWVPRNSEWDNLPPVKVPVIPVIAFPNDDGTYTDAMVDSSPQIARLEQTFSQRSVVPADPALAFIDFLLEDYADEWVTKAMYHYRWTYDPDIEKAGRLLPQEADLQASDESLGKMHDFIIERQVSRRALVGSTDANLPVIEGTYHRLLGILQAHLGSHHFVLGGRPARTDFALFGQLKPLVWWDPTPMAIAVHEAPRVPTWLERLDDLSWWPDTDEADWDQADALPPTVHQLLTEAGATYAPFMLANAAALESGASEVVCDINGAEYRQDPFKYQGKCLVWLREAYASLDDASRATVDDVLGGTGCETLVA